MTARIRIGCSGWQYRGWAGRFYPDGLPMTRWFAYYASVFDTVELNTTFYRLPAESTTERWRDVAPDGFVYAVKLGSYGSHRRRLREPQPWLANHLDRIERLGPTLGPTVVQLPPRWHRDVPRLDDFLAVAPTERQRWALEVRDPSWLHDDVFAVLERHGVALCLHDLLPDHPWIRTASWTYLRFHGPDATRAAYRGRYGPRRLALVADRLDPWIDEGTDVYGYFNNDVDADAPVDAVWLRDRLRSLVS